MYQYSPTTLKNAILNEEEVHFASYTLSPYKYISHNNYSPSLSYYTAHLTSTRIIIESDTNQEILEIFHNLIKYFPTPDNIFLGLYSIIGKNKFNQARKNMEYLTNKHISIKYQEIQEVDSFVAQNRQMGRIILNPYINNANNTNFIDFYRLNLDTFKSYPVQKIDINIFSDKNLKDGVARLWKEFNKSIQAQDSTLDFVSCVKCFHKFYSKQT